MSKMSQLHAELSEQAYELGFESIGEAEQAGYGVDWNRGKLVDGRELAHEAWLKERDYHVERLNQVAELLDTEAMPVSAGTIRQAAKFLGECHD